MDSIGRKILDLKEFKEEFAKVLHASVLGILPDEIANDQTRLSIDWNYVLMCASFLAQANDAECQDAALRIAQHCLTSQQDYSYQVAAAIVLGKLTNDPAIKLAIEKELISENYTDDIPRPLLIEKMVRDQLHTVEVQGVSQYLNKFQKELYIATTDEAIVSASAPTSAGKSFVLSLIVAKALSETRGRARIVYVVPTRALINEIEDRFDEGLEKYGLRGDVYISSIPKIPSARYENSSHLYIFTQERLHWFLTDNPQYKIDLLIVDEAQKIGDRQRGILLQEKIEQVQKINPSARVVFCSAFSRNPETLLEISNKDGVSICTDYVSVNQNLIWLSRVPRKPREWEVVLCLKDKSIPISRLQFPSPLSTLKAKCSKLPLLLGREGGNLIYASGPASAEAIAKSITDELAEAGAEKEDATFEDLKDLCKRLIHPNYLLPDLLPYGVAFHYGNMPLSVRKEIENLFRSGHIKYLVCTSTLLEGVNLSAKSIFITNPSRGRGTPMSETDFWNLAGRAGRLTSEFQGNIFCIEPQEWTHKPLWAERRYEIKKSLSEITSNEDNFVGFVERHLESADVRNQDMEYALSYFYLKYLDGDHEAIFSQELMPLLEKIKNSVSITRDILQRNPGISPVAMQRLYDYFGEREDPTELLPPESLSQESAVNDYTAIVGRVNNHLNSERFPIPPFKEALLAVQWMRGYPLPRIIIGYFGYLKRKGSDPDLSKIIREVMKDIEDGIRFGFAKFVMCYLDVLRLYLVNTNRLDLVALIPDIRTWIEFGVSELTQVSLINIGFSRHVAIELSKMIGDASFNEDQTVEWVKKLDLRVVELPRTFREEVSRIQQMFAD